jgi:hypothetical protein
MSGYAQEQSNNSVLNGYGISGCLIGYGAVAIPLEDFANGDGGGAKTGFSVGVNYLSPSKMGLVINADYSYNGVKPGKLGNATIGNWNTICILGGVNVLSGELTTGYSYYVAPMIGGLIGITPTVDKTTDAWVDGWWVPVRASTPAVTSGAFAVGLMAGVQSGRFSLGLNFIVGKPKYTSTITSTAMPGGVYTSSSVSTSYHQQIEILQVFAGYSF